MEQINAGIKVFVFLEGEIEKAIVQVYIQSTHIYVFWFMVSAINE